MKTVVDLLVEREYLAACLLEPATLHVHPLAPADFGARSSQTIHAAMTAIVLRREPLDTAALRIELERTGRLESVGGVSVLLEMTERIPHDASALARRIRELARLRELGDVATRIQAAVHERDLAAARQVAAELLVAEGDEDDVSIGFRELLARGVEASIASRRDKHGFRLGMPAIDSDYRPSPGHLVVVGARPNVGKTSMVWQWHIDMAKRGIPTGLVSVDDDDAEYGVRGLGAISGMNPRRLWNERLQPEDFGQVMAAVDKWADMPIRFKHVRSKSLDRVLGAMSHMVRVHGVQMISIDFLTAIRGRPSKDSREQHNNTLSEIHALAGVLGVPVVLIVQLKRGDSSNAEFREPNLGDFAETGALEQHAQAAILLWRKSDKPGEPVYGKVAKIKRTDRGKRFVLDRHPETGLLHQVEDRLDAPEPGDRWS